MSFHFFLIFVLTVFVASIVPGPSMLLALTHGMKHGARKTVASACGNLSVTVLQASVSVAGLGAILLASEGLFNIIKGIGAAYLIYIGIGIWRSPHDSVSAVPAVPCLPEVPLRRLFLQGVFVTAGNPKAIIFFTAVFPQFMNPEAPFIPQFVLLIGTGSIIAFTCFMIYAVSGQKIIAVFSGASIGKYINKVLGGTFIAAGIGLALSRK